MPRQSTVRDFTVSTIEYMDSIEKMKTSESWKNLKLQDLYKCPWFFGELSEEDAKEILVEAKNSVFKDCL